MTDSSRAFAVARNPDADSKLPCLLLLPLEDGSVLKARELWPATARVYCHRFEQGWPAEAEIVDQAPVLLCRRRGAAIDLVLDRPRLARSQFVFAQVKGREAIFWQTQKTARAGNPAAGFLARAPSPARSRSRSTPGSATPTASPSKEPRRCGRPFSPATTRCTRPTAVCSPRSSARAWRTSPPRSRTELSPSRCNASPSSRSPPWSSKLGTRRCTNWNTSNGGWLADRLARLEVRYPEVHLVFADSRRFAEEWTYRFLTTALAEASDQRPND